MINTITMAILLLELILMYKRKEFASPLFSFCGIWLIVLIFYTIRLFGITSINTDTAWLIFAGLVSFVLGFICTKRIKIRTNTVTSQPNWAMLNIICILLIVISFPYYVSSLINMIKSGVGVAAYKLLLVTGEVDAGGVIMQYVVRPFEYLIMGMSAYVLSRSIKQRIIFASGLYFCFIKFFTTGSKTAFLYLGLSFVFAILNNKGSEKRFYAIKKLKKKQKIMIFFVAVAFCIAVNSASGNFFKSIYIYLVGCIPMLDRVLHNSFYFNNYMYGWISFNGIARFFISIFELMGFSLNTIRFDEATSIISRFEYTVQISDEIKYNAFTTYISNFYIDYGSVGVIIGSFLFGGVVCYIYRKYKQEQSIIRFAQLSIIYYMVVFSIVRFQLSHTVTAMAFIYSIILIVFQNSSVKIKLRK